MHSTNQYLRFAQAHHIKVWCRLIAGRLSHSLGSKNTALSLIMGPPEVWQAPEGPTLAPQRAGQRQSALDGRAAAKSLGAALHEALQQQLRSGKSSILCCVVCMQLIMLCDGASKSGQPLNWLIYPILRSVAISEGCAPAAGC